LTARAEALNGRLTTFDTLAAVRALRRSRLTSEAKARSGRALAKYETALAAADDDYFPRAAEFRGDVAEFARDAFQAGHGVAALLRLVDTSGHELPEAIAAARVELRLIALGESVAKPDTAEDARKRRALELWNRGDKWTDVAEAVDGTPEFWRPLQQEIRRFAAANNLPMRKGSPGAKRLT